jgi:hypothetical protein
MVIAIFSICRHPDVASRPLFRHCESIFVHCKSATDDLATQDRRGPPPWRGGGRSRQLFKVHDTQSAPTALVRRGRWNQSVKDRFCAC